MRRQIPLTKEITAKLPGLLTNLPKDTPIIVKFFQPWGGWTWFVVAGDPTGETFAIPGTNRTYPEYRFFGMVHGEEKELGYFLLSELMSVRGPLGLYIERDIHFGFDHKLSEVM